MLNEAAPMVWQLCLDRLEIDLTPQQFSTWIRPLQVIEDGHILRLLAPNRFVRDQVSEHLLKNIEKVIRDCRSIVTNITIEIGSHSPIPPDSSKAVTKSPNVRICGGSRSATGLQVDFTFENFVEGKSNQMARAASIQVASNPGNTYNPLFIYGGVGLGKTHLMHAIGNRMLEENPDANVIYLHSERFVAEMITALRHNTINEFKKFYRSVDALLIDDIQFFAGKERSQEEFFHTFNTLIESDQLISLTSDRYPKEIDDLEERLKSRFSWGLPVAIEPPELEIRAAILINKAAALGANVPDEVAYFIAQRMHSNIRDILGALNRVIANAEFTGRSISVDLAKEALRDLLVLQEKLVTIENIQSVVAKHFKLRVADLVSKKRTRTIVRPRQLAMTLAKELTNHSLPEIGDAFGGRDHTTVLHACRKITELREENIVIAGDYNRLLRTLTS